MGLKFWKTVLQLLAGVTVSALLLFLLAEGIRKSAGEIHLEDLAAVVKSIPLWVIGFAVFCQLTQGWLRSLRYSLLLKWESGVEIPKRSLKLLTVTFARNMFVDMLPFRSGELVYVWLVKRILGANIANGFSSLGAAFVFDLVALLLIILLVVGLAIFAGLAIPPAGFLLLLLGIVTVAVVGFFFIFPWFMDWTAVGRMHRFRAGVVGKIHGFVEDMSDCILDIRGRGKLWSISGYSLLIRLFKYAGIVTMLYVILERSFGSVGLANVGSLFSGIVAGEASASLPLPSFMSFGTYEAGASLTLQGLGFSLQAAAISIFIVHVFSQVIDYSLGGFALLVAWLSGWFERGNNASNSKNPLLMRWVLALIFGGLVAVAAAAIAMLEYQKANEKPELPPAVSLDESVLATPVDTAEIDSDLSSDEPTRSFSAEVSTKPLENVVDTEPGVGFAVWSSNRFGNHEIVKYNFDSEKLERLTETVEKEFYVSISPGGGKLVYARAEEPGRSARNFTGWEVVLHDMQSGQTEVLSSNSFHPSWAGDDSQVIYSRNGNEVVLHDLATGERRVLIRAGENGIPSGFEFSTPHYNSKKEALAVTTSGTRQTKFVFSMKPGIAPLELPEGCQLSWMPDNEKMVFTNHGRVGDTAFQIVDPKTSEVVTLLDLPTEYHHIYFPRFSENGKWLIYGASKGDHEHDQADYDIFLWRVGSPIESIQQLASDPANDSWPDLHLPE